MAEEIPDDIAARMSHFFAHETIQGETSK
jgi:hypothetical protein